MITKGDLEVLADSFAGAYQFHVQPFQKPEQYTTRLATWRGTLETVAATLKVNNPRFDRDRFNAAIAKATGLTMAQVVGA